MRSKGNGWSWGIGFLYGFSMSAGLSLLSRVHNDNRWEQRCVDRGAAAWVIDEAGRKVFTWKVEKEIRP